ncbi:hypothetical protein SAMN02910447_03215 [Ruminococcus sp. YE71]|uniref:hypothetical protein n=1 Tax=unclassified Ruminococcus TaxID=2608920 RepID=UPI00089191D0|nr:MULTISPECIES: hypothetical protein [unclassified Ruminococcus]SDA30665.1 hypothetical protein SAMN02910446_03306 [Ruminococcus sp. YE78]SFW49938.1 hypothetical protein SAMN02910447_03215 [Ruminococcus sp. YE71]
MRMTKMAGKTAAVLSAMAIVGSAAATVAPAAFANVTNGIVASAAEDFQYSGTYFTGDLYCAVGDTFTMEVTLGKEDKQYGTDGFTYEWYYSTDKVKGTNDISKFNWTKMNYTTKKVSIKMTQNLDGAHIYAVKVNKSTGAKTSTPMRTVSATAVKSKLGTATVKTSGNTTKVYVPFYLTGCISQQISAVTLSLKVDTNVFSGVSFNNAVSGLSGLDNFIASKGEYKNALFNANTPAVIGSDNLFGTFVLTVKDGAKYEGSKVTLALETASLTGDNISGDIVYGTTPVTAAISTSSSTSKYPVATATTSKNAFKLDWTAVDGADKYCVAYYSAGKWKILAQGNVLTYSRTGVPAGTYKVVVGAKINGNWDTSNINARAITMTIPG